MILPNGCYKIGYIWQYEASEVFPIRGDRVSATALHIQAVVRGLQGRGHHVRLVTVMRGRPHWSENLVDWQPVSPLPRPPAALRAIERPVRWLQNNLNLPFVRFFDSYRFSLACAAALQGYDVFYERFWLMASGGLQAARRLSVPLVYEVNGDLVEEYRLLGIDLPPGQWGAIYQVTRTMFRAAARVVTVSETLRQRTIERWGLDPARVTRVENGARVDLFAAAGPAGTGQPRVEPRSENGVETRVEPRSENGVETLEPSAAVRRRYGLDSGSLVMFVGSFKPWHGLDLLVEAFRQVAQAHPEARLAFVGDGPVRPDLEQQARAAGLDGRVLFTGSVPHDEVAGLLQASQVAVLNPRVSPASLSQSPLKLFEYMAAGKAIVAPAIPNMQRLLADREDALLVPPDRPEALAAAISELLADPALAARLGQAARAKALAEHSWERTVSELESVFAASLERREAAPA